MSTDSTLAATQNGRVRGGDLGDVRVWRGIPYAERPTGHLRFRAPQPAAGWAGVGSATAFGPQAWQSEIRAAIREVRGRSGGEL